MSKSRYLYIDGHKVPVSEDFYKEYRRLVRKEIYFSRDLKSETFVYDPEKQIAAFVTSREDSYERLVDLGTQFPDSSEAVEDTVVRSILLEKLHQALQTLSSDEMSLLYEIFFLERSEREISQRMGIRCSSLHERKTRILKKLRKLIESF